MLVEEETGKDSEPVLGGGGGVSGLEYEDEHL